MKNAAILFFVIAIVLGCSSENEIELPNDQFSAVINGKYWSPSESVSSIYYKGVLNLGARDSADRNGNSDWFWIGIELIDPVLGINTVDNLGKNSSITLWHWTSKTGEMSSATGSTSGHVVLTKFDTINGSLSGTFESTFNYPDRGLFYKIRDGQFSDIVIRDVFCKPEYEFYQPDSISLFNKWGLIGFKESNSSFSYPPCENYPYIIIHSDSVDSNKGWITGRSTVNSFGLSFQIVDKYTIITKFITATKVGGSRVTSPYENRIFDFLGYSTLSYELSDNQLFLTNTESSYILVLSTIKP